MSSQQNIYDSIRKREIIMPEEHTGQLGFEYAWKELLARSRQTGRSFPLSHLIGIKHLHPILKETI